MAAVTALACLMVGYMFGKLHQRIAAHELYLHEQSLRREAEREILHLKRTRLALEDALIDEQKKGTGK